MVSITERKSEAQETQNGNTEDTEELVGIIEEAERCTEDNELKYSRYQKRNAEHTENMCRAVYKV